MAHKIAGLVLNAARVVWKSVAEAYQHTILSKRSRIVLRNPISGVCLTMNRMSYTDAKQAANQGAQQAASEASQSRFSRKMRPEEAYGILNLKKGATLEELNEVCFVSACC